MKILFAGLEYPNYNPDFGFSFEYNNFFLSLKEIPGVEAKFLSYQDILTLGRQGYNQALLTEIKSNKPDLFFAFMYSDEFDPGVLKEINRHTNSLAWFSDDHWRFWNYSLKWAPYFNWIATTYSPAVEWYKKRGFSKIIKSQWAANPSVYFPQKTGIDPDAGPDVCFIGMSTKPRQKIVKNLEQAGIRISAYGAGWPNGRISREEMIKLFSSAKINLAINEPNLDFSVKSLGRLIARRSLNKFVPDFNIIANARSFLSGLSNKSIKGRHFEITACSGFCLTSKADDIENYFIEDKEMVFYNNEADLIAKIKYYLKNDSERKQIAETGYRRVLKDHTYHQRFLEIFNAVGLKQKLNLN